MAPGTPRTLADMQAVLTRWILEDMDPDTLTDAINDAIEDVWEQCCLFHLNMFVQGPITTLTFGLANERALLVSIVDPAVPPSTAFVAGGNLAVPRSLDFAYTYVTDSGTETNLSPVATFVNSGTGTLATVGPPVFTQGVPSVVGAIGWNLYACVTGSDTRMARQNLDPLPFDYPWTEPVAGITQNPLLPGPPTSNTTADDISYIKHMEIQRPDTTYMAWNEADIDSQVFRSFAATVSSASPYSQYVWDLVNRQTIELRPPAGLTLTPRYWYIQRPRRLAFPNSLIPFQNIIGIDGYIRKAALSDLTLSIHEYQASAAWDKKAAVDLVRILQTVNQSNWATNKRVAPVMTW